MSANGRFKIEFNGGAQTAFTDHQKVAGDIAATFIRAGIEATVWEKDHSGWEKIYPPPKSLLQKIEETSQRPVRG